MNHSFSDGNGQMYERYSHSWFGKIPKKKNPETIGFGVFAREGIS